MRVLVVEDHADLRALTAAHLESRGFLVDVAASLADARAHLRLLRYDVVVLDLGLPDGDGRDLIRRREAPPGAEPPPVVVLTARDGLDDRLEGLNAGADDYMVKPFKVEELEARLRAVMRRPGLRAPPRLDLGSLSFDTIGRELRVAGAAVPLRRRESLVLEALLLAEGRLVVRDVLLDRLYGLSEPVTPNALEMAVSRLRRVLADSGSGVGVQAQRGVGYRLVREGDGC